MQLDRYSSRRESLPAAHGLAVAESEFAVVEYVTCDLRCMRVTAVEEEEEGVDGWRELERGNGTREGRG
jgi:hypothetical protein